MPYLILVAGGSGSGKSTIVDKITQQFENISVINIDDYYKDNSHLRLEERVKINYDHPDSVDLDLLYTNLLNLLDNKEIISPIYDFTVHNRSSETKIVKPNDIIIVEGIFALIDERIRRLSSLKLFIETDSDIRLARRILRDIKSRGRSIDDIIAQYLQTVKPMYDKFVSPTKKYADILIPYEDFNEVAVDIISMKLKNI